MSTDLTTSAPAPIITTESMALIESTAASLGHAHKIATALCNTAFAPPHFKGKPEEAAAAILYGSQIGLDPLGALQNVYVISGKPALYARTMVAVVMAAGHRIWTEESTDRSVTVSGQRRNSEAVETITWTLERAKLAGYTSNKKYQTDPQAMLYARAAGDVARRIAPDALLGMAYTVEEMQVIEPATPQPRQSAADLLAAAPEPAEEEAAVVPDSATRQQIKWIQAWFTRQQITERDAKLAFLTEAAGRPIASSNDLTKAEAIEFINAAGDAETPGGDA